MTPPPLSSRPTGGAGGADDARLAELSGRLAAVRSRIAAAATAAGRDPADLTLVVVTKTWPAQDVHRLARLGVRDVGENRDQEASAKAALCAELPLRWHFVGQVQTNKAASVASYADWVHSVDRPRLVDALSKGAQRNGRTLTCLVQVALDADPGTGDGSRAGARTPDVPRLADQVAAAPGLVLGGVMGVAPLAGDPVSAFARLRAVAEDLRGRHPDAAAISAGMSGDVEAAIDAGATHLRLGTAVLGSRPPLG